MNPATETLRLALVASSLRRGGAEKQTVYLARALLCAGADLRVFYPGAGGYYEDILRQWGVPVFRIHLEGRPWRTLAKVTTAVWRFRPQIVLAAQFADLLYGIPAGRGCHALVLGGVRSDGFYELNAHGRWSRWLQRLAHGLVANSDRARENLISQGVDPRKLAVLPNLVDLEEFDALSRQPLLVELPANRVVVAAVGSLHPCKRFDRFLEALALARQREPSLAGVVAGVDAGEGAALRRRASELGLTSEDLLFTGECDHVPSLLTHVALLVLTSAYEGFPNVILEAMAARLPVISTPVGDARRIVEEGRTGFIVEPDDTPAIAERLVQLARSPAMRASFGETGRQRVERQYQFDLLPRRLLEVFHRFACLRRRGALRRILERGSDVSPSDAYPRRSLYETPAT